ncbi:GNAT family N-acetyltransferase [Paenibacillus apiarius]|uniref:GNAT family N-acetyltransferase n=1 Tax=Paenibacillus apiarius TaxID=46240 RepID=UPI00197DCA46|nr:GNAT family N-acetyltransferase [Paenibacillus apiarius]MBN3527383.1 GNAT family N-acetyltransferase [Paenibacillus apiarius]
MSICIRAVTPANWKECIELKPKKEQEGFIATNLYSIAEAQFLDNFTCKAIYLDETMIGFAMFGIDADDHNYWIYRFMIDRNYQGRGYGKQAMLLILDDINQKENCAEAVFLGYDPMNEQAANLYRAVGFVETGIAPWGEIVAKYTFMNRDIP